MLKLIKALEKDKEFVLNYFTLFTENIYLIYKDDKCCGVIEYTCFKELIRVDYIHIFIDYRGNGYGTGVINLLKKEYPNCAIYGDASPKESAFCFWNNLRAEFDAIKNFIIHKNYTFKI